MKPIQMSQRKQASDWIECKAWIKVTWMKRQLDQIQASTSTPTHTNINTFSKELKWLSLNWPATRKRIATLLVEYYEILFNPEYRNIFWYDSIHNIDQLKNLTLLFPIDDPISIHYSTNFILLPLPIPTYEERTHRWTYKKNCPFLRFDTRDVKTDSSVDTLINVNELVRDMDYSIDSNVIEVSSSKDCIQWQREKRELYRHTDPWTKLQWTNKPLPRNEARLWTYKYQDVPKRIADRLPKDYETGWYSIRDVWMLMNTDKEVRNRKYKEYFTRNRLIVKRQQYTKTKMVLLEIPAQTWPRAPDPRNEKIFYKLEDYSRTYLTDTMFTWNEFWKYFDFSYTKATKDEVINYFVKNALPINEYCPLQIKSGITKLKNMIKDYNKKHKQLSQPNQQDHYKKELDSQLDLNSPYYQTWRGRPTRDYLDTHWAKWYKPDWTVESFETYDERATYKKSIDQLKSESLSINNNTND